MSAKTKKIIGAVLAAILLVSAVAIAATYPLIGHWVYHDGARTEARLRGFATEQVDAGDSRFTIYRGGPANAAETVVLLHGYSSDRQIWARFASSLTDRYQVIIPDLAGHGDTDFVPGLGYSAPTQAQRVANMLDSLGVDKVHIAGNSMGGFITAHFALAYPERTLSAALFDPAGVTSPEQSDMERMLAQGRNPFEIRTREEFDEFYPMTMAKPPWMPGFVLAAVAEQYQARLPELAEIKNDFHDNNMLNDRLDEYSVPVLVVWGDQDRLLHVSAAKVWADGIPNAELHVFEGIGHMPMFEIPKESSAVYRAFITKHPR